MLNHKSIKQASKKLVKLSKIISTLCPKKHVTTFSVITLTISVRLQYKQYVACGKNGHFLCLL